MESERITQAYRASNIARFINEGYNLTHTKEMLSYIDRVGSDREKTSELFRIVSELELVVKDAESDLKDFQKQHIKGLLGCARNDIFNREYWDSVMDIFYIESAYLQEHLPRLPVIDEEARAEFVLLKKIASGLGFKLVVIRKIKSDSEVSFDDYDSADWWKR